MLEVRAAECVGCLEYVGPASILRVAICDLDLRTSWGGIVADDYHYQVRFDFEGWQILPTGLKMDPAVGDRWCNAIRF